MTNNEILRSIRYTFDFRDSKMTEIFALSDKEVSTEDVEQWLKKDEDPAYKSMRDEDMAAFLNGLIIEKRGKKDGPQRRTEKRLNNNSIFMKLKIALNMQSEDVLETLKLAGLDMGKHELSAFFRNPGQKNYRECKDQALRNFLTGLRLKHRTANWSQREKGDKE